MNAETAEIEVLETLVKTCRAIRDTRRPKARLELAAPAATWELEFATRIDELKKQIKQPELLTEHAHV